MRPFSSRMMARWSRMVDVRGADECWPWRGRPDGKGYGFIKVWGKTTRAHRVAWALAHGDWPPAGLVVRHTCDKPPCCNPAHLVLGTVRDNVRDCVERSRRAKGSSVAAAKLTEQDVAEIRKRAKEGDPNRLIALDYGVTRQAIAHIVERRNWRHVA